MHLPFDTHKQYFFETEQDNLQELLFTLDSICTLFDKYFAPTGLPLTVAIRTGKDPECIRPLHRIYLNTQHLNWCQAAYQFAHELCHYMIPYDVCKNLRWLEESICELASYFFLRELTDYWLLLDIKYSTADNLLYAEQFARYALEDSQTSTVFDVTLQSEITLLEKDCYLRKKNKHIANLLLPIFQEHPDTWNSVPILCQILPGLSLYDSLKNWLLLSPDESLIGLRKIAYIFFPPNSL